MRHDLRWPCVHLYLPCGAARRDCGAFETDDVDEVTCTLCAARHAKANGLDVRAARTAARDRRLLGTRFLIEEHTRGEEARATRENRLLRLQSQVDSAPIQFHQLRASLMRSGGHREKVGEAHVCRATRPRRFMNRRRKHLALSVMTTNEFASATATRRREIIAAYGWPTPTRRVIEDALSRHREWTAARMRGLPTPHFFQPSRPALSFLEHAA